MSNSTETGATAKTAPKVVRLRPTRKLPSLWPWIAFVGGLLLCNFSVMIVHRMVFEWSGSWVSTFSSIIVIAGIGSLSGQACLMAVLGGLFGRSWISGYAIAALLAAVGVGLLLAGEELSMSLTYAVAPRHWHMVIMTMLLAPLFVMAVSVPTLAMRLYCGWRLTRDEMTSPPQRSIGLEDLFIGTAIVAAGLVLTLAARELGEMRASEFWIPGAVCFTVMAAASLIIVLPTLWVAFRIENSLLRLVMFASMAVGFSGLVVVAVVVTNYVMSRGGGSVFDPFETALYTTAWMISAATTFLVGLSLLKAVGFKLTRSSELVLVLTDKDTVQTRQDVKQHRRLAATVFAVAVAINLGVMARIGTRESRFRALQAKHQELSHRSGSLSLNAEQAVVELSLGTDATSDDVQAAVTAYPQLKRLSLANSQIVDADLKLLSSFPQLQSLNLNGTQISDAGLRELAKLPFLDELLLADTRVTIDGLVRLLTNRRLNTLDLGNLGLTEANLEQLAKIPDLSVLSLSLRGNPVSVWGVMRLKHVSGPIDKLDLTDCDLNAQSLWLLTDRRYDALTLDGTPLTDAMLAPLLPKLTVRELSFDRTQVTDAIFPDLATAKGVTGLVLGETRITEAGLAASALTTMHYLSLNSPQFNGSCFAIWKPKDLRSLDMRGSAVTDQAIFDIMQLPSVKYLDLSQTSITDAALPALTQMKLRQLDLSHTRVTAVGLAQSDFGIAQVHLSLDQFTAAQYKQIRRAVNVTFEPMPQR